MNHLTAREVATAMGGKVSPSNPNIARVPSEGHSRHDDGLAVIITDADPEGFITHSHQGDDWRDCRDYVRSKLGLQRPEYKKPAMRFVPPKPKGEKTGSRREVASYVYLDKDGDPSFRVVRYEFEGGAKTFEQERWSDIDGIWIKRLDGQASIPYNLPTILQRHDEPIWLVEGEKNADDLTALGFVATTARGGASAFPKEKEFGAWFDGATVYALPDNDGPGEKWLAAVLSVIPDAKVVRLPGLPDKGDVSDWLAAGGTAQELLAIATENPNDSASSLSMVPTPFEWVEPSSIPQRAVLYGNHLYRKFVSMTVSPGGLGKSSMVMVEALAMASNQPLLGEPIYDGPLRVWYWNGEDPQDENTRRIVAAATHHKLHPSKFADRLWIDSGRSLAFKVASMARGDLVVSEEVFLALEQAISERGIDVLVLDPFVSIHSVPENDNGAIDAIVKRLGLVADRCNCAIELVHHVRKPGGGTNARTDMHDARGAGALTAGVRSGRVLNVMSEEEATDARIPSEDRFSYFSVDMGKANLAKRDGRAVWRQLVSVPLGNDTPIRPGDMVGVVDRYEPPASMAMDIWPDNAAELAQRIAEGDETLRYWSGNGPATNDWFGFAVARVMGLDEQEHRKDIRRMISRWVKAEILVLKESRVNGNKVIYVASGRTQTNAPTHEEAEIDDDTPF